MLAIDGDVSDWSARTRLDTAQTGAAGYGLYGQSDTDTFNFAITSANGPIGANTTIWLDVDLNRHTGYQIWGFTGGVEYNVNFTIDGRAKLYTGSAGQTFVADLDYAFASDGSVAEIAIPKALLDNAPDRIRVFADVNDTVFLPNDYANIDMFVGAPASVSVGDLTIDGDLSDWLAQTRLDKPQTGTDGYGFYGKFEIDSLVFAISSEIQPIGANTTIWLDTDLDRQTGYQIWGFAGGVEYNINFTEDNRALLYKGGAGETFIAELDYAVAADGSVAEIAISKTLLGGVDEVRVFADVNDTAFLPNDYANVDMFVRSPLPISIGNLVIDGNLSDWSLAARLDTPQTGSAGYGLYGQAEAGHYLFAITSEDVAIGASTTIWLDTDLNRATGYQIWGFAGGAEYNVNFTSDGKAVLYTGGAGQTFVANLDYALAADGSVAEIAIPTALLGDTSSLRVLADVNDAVFLPNQYTGSNLLVTDNVSESADSVRIAIVYSETSADNFYDKTAYGQLFMAAQSQAMQAGVPFDLLLESDLKNAASLARYDAIVFPGFSHLRASDLDDIETALTLASQSYGVGMIAAGNFMTNDETGAAFAGDSYARMDAILGVRAQTFGTTEGLQLVAKDGVNPILHGYDPGEIVGTYGNTAYNAFTDTTGTGQVLFEQRVDSESGTQDVAAVIATQGISARNIHFASDAIFGNNNVLQSAIDWVVAGDHPSLSLEMTRGSLLFNSRTDMDQSQETFDVQETSPGIYDEMLPIVESWYQEYGFVGSYYVNVGHNPPDQATDWSISGSYYRQLLALENEIGTHSYTHPEDTNLLSDGDPRLAELLGAVDPRNPDAVDPSTLSSTDRSILEGSFIYQFQFSALKIASELGVDIVGAAVPGAPEKLNTSLQILPFFDYLSGGYSGVGAGYPNAFGFLTPEVEGVYIAPNMSFDFSLVGFRDMSPEQAAAEWAKEYASIVDHASVPIVSFPWHDYGPTDWDLGDPLHKSYDLEMFEAVIAQAAMDGAEFVTGADLASRIQAFSASSLDVSQNGSVITATLTSTDAGRFALAVSEGEAIAGVEGWYAYDATKVFTPQDGGTFVVHLGEEPSDVTHLVSLPMRANLLAVSGDGANLSAAFEGLGEIKIALRTQGSDAVVITGADSGQFDGPTVTAAFATKGTHETLVNYRSGGEVQGTASTDLISGGSSNDRIVGGTGDDVMRGGGGADLFVFSPGAGHDVVVDFATGTQKLAFDGLGFTSASEIFSLFVETEAGLSLSYGQEDTLMLAGLGLAGLKSTDILVDSSGWA
ncbi:MAG: hypothetical protein VYD57_11365 [Pseudomonadota bacterium]|nr:hypothetical protein [Pseudomonadota bacterium]